MQRHDAASTSTRRQFLRGAGAAALGLTAFGCGKSPENGGEFRGQTITVFVYSGLDKLIQDHFVLPFEAHTGAKVVLDAGWWDAIGKLKATPNGEAPPYDLVLTDATQGYPAIKSGMFRQLDLEKIPNYRALTPSAIDNWVVKERYGVTFHESAQTLVWNRREVGFDPTSWGDLLRDELRKKISLYDSFYVSLYTFACMKVASEGKPGTAHAAIANDLGEVLDFAKRERGRIRFWWSKGPRMLQDLVQGNFAAGNAHSVGVFPIAREKPDVVGFVTPEKDRAYVQLMWVVPSKTPNPTLAEAAIDFLLRQDVQAALARSGAGTSHVAAAKEVAREDPVWAKTYPSTDEQFRTMKYFPYEAYFKDWDRITKTWEEEVLRKS